MAVAAVAKTPSPNGNAYGFFANHAHPMIRAAFHAGMAHAQRPTTYTPRPAPVQEAD